MSGEYTKYNKNYHNATNKAFMTQQSNKLHLNSYANRW